LLRAVLLSLAHHHTQSSHGWMTDEGLNRPAQHGFAAKQPKLFRLLAAHAGAAAGGDDQGCGGHGGGV